jgi:SAM-dependent methyltransferase
MHALAAPGRAVRRRAAVLGLLLAAATGCAELRARYPGPDVLFIPTPEGVSVEMLRLASVTPRDVVYDLGSGDGRVVVAAAHEFGARGVGVEIDANLVQSSRDRAYGAGVAERATFLWQDLFVTDLHEATVVTLYLRDDVNLRLRPKLLRELAPGSRVVSHDFDMGDWRPDRVQRVRGPSRNHALYLWLIPAEVAGLWRTRLGEREGVLNLTQRYQSLGGTLSLDGRELPITDAAVSGDRLSFTAGALVFTGRVGGDAMEGRAGERAEPTALAWTSRRVR